MLNLWPLVRIVTKRMDDLLTIIISLRVRLWNLVILGIAVVTLSTLLIYVAVENFGHI